MWEKSTLKSIDMWPINIKSTYYLLREQDILTTALLSKAFTLFWNIKMKTLPFPCIDDPWEQKVQ